MDYSGFKGRKVIITGGLGFIGSTLAIRLVDLGARVVVVDSLIPEYGGNLFNVKGYEGRLKVNIADVRDEFSMSHLIRGEDFLFNLAGQTSHIDSMENPYTDLDINCRSQLFILEACRKYNPGIKVVYAGTRQVYGKPDVLPVNEDHPIRPVDVNGIHKMAGEWYHRLYYQVYGIRTCSLRLTNTYGPRMRIKDARQTFLGVWIRALIEGKPIEVWGDGLQIRDFNYVDDAVSAMLAVALSEKADGQVYNLGDSDPVSLKTLAELMVRIFKGGQYRILPFPGKRKAIDIGDYYADFSRIRSDFQWTPQNRIGRGTVQNLRILPPAYRTLPMIPQNNPLANYLSLKPDIDDAVERVFKSGWYILGEETSQFERLFAEYLGVRYAVGVANGTEAICLALQACGVKLGDEVISVSHTAVATISAIEMCGAIPRLAEIDPTTYTMNPASLAPLLTHKTRAIVPVHLYGHPADLQPIVRFAEENGLLVIEDCAQSHGAAVHERKTGTWGHAAAFSFYPTKNLGCLGDGGAVATNDSGIYERLLAARQYGWDKERVSRTRGLNSRLDEIQAAVLKVKLGRLDDNNRKRAEAANRYTASFSSLPLTTPAIMPARTHVYHQYVIRLSDSRTRNGLLQFLKAGSIHTAIHYPVPVHLQPFYSDRFSTSGSLKETESVCQTILSLPMFPELTTNDIDQVCDRVHQFFREAVQESAP